MATLLIESLRTRQLGPLDLQLADAECVCLSGASGCGKSTLLRAIADLDPHEGELRLDGQSCVSMPAHVWRKQVGLLAAESHWWLDTVGPHFASIEEPWFSALGFEQDVLAWDVARLSSGERQRLALLRLLCNRPRVLLLDEATANLDHDNSLRMEALIADYQRQQQAPVLWISHDPEQIARVATRHLRIEQGGLTEVQP